MIWSEKEKKQIRKLNSLFESAKVERTLSPLIHIRDYMSWVACEYYEIAIIIWMYNSVFIIAYVEDTYDGWAERHTKMCLWFCPLWVGVNDVSLVEISPSQWQIGHRYSPVYIGELLYGFCASWNLYVHLCVLGIELNVTHDIYFIAHVIIVIYIWHAILHLKWIGIICLEGVSEYLLFRVC